jgi:hypothetical protein
VGGSVTRNGGIDFERPCVDPPDHIVNFVESPALEVEGRNHAAYAVVTIADYFLRPVENLFGASQEFIQRNVKSSLDAAQVDFGSLADIQQLYICLPSDFINLSRREF